MVGGASLSQLTGFVLSGGPHKHLLKVLGARFIVTLTPAQPEVRRSPTAARAVNDELRDLHRVVRRHTVVLLGKWVDELRPPPPATRRPPTPPPFDPPIWANPPNLP